MRTLRNAVEREKVHHAYLFVGSRGTGKTSMAKILAACLNCEQGPTTEPCGHCDSCRSIAAASSLDVIEMDAASNNSVDDIRELRESVAYAPVSGRRKIYILDEAHMLSAAAWNAFLKTLEEPPPNTVFVLATTEAAKVPATVVDRCHRFDFHRPTVAQITSVLARVAASESIEIGPPALAAVARSATGSFRDALGTLEQLVTYSGSVVALEDVLAVLGVADSRLLAEAVDAVAAGDPGRALRALEQCLEQGRDAASFATDLEARVRELMIVQTLGEVPGELSLTPESDTALAEQAARVGHSTVIRLLELLGEALEAARAGADARTRLELALIKAARPEADGSLRALLSRIERLEEERATVTAVGSPREIPLPPAVASPREIPLPATPAAGAPAPAEPQGGRADVPPAGAQPGPAAASGPPGDTAPPPPSATATVTATLAEPAQAGDGSLESLLELWPAVVELVRGENALLGALIAEARPVAVAGEELTLAFGSPFLKRKAEDPAHRVTVAEALRVLTTTRWRLGYELREDLPAVEAASEEPSEERWLARFMEEFDAEEVPGEWGAARGGEPAEAGEAQTVNGNEKGA